MNRRNGYRERRFDTRTGTISLAVPKLRSGSYFPDWLLEPRRRAERALVQVVAECYVRGVSTRRVDGRGKPSRGLGRSTRSTSGRDGCCRAPAWGSSLGVCREGDEALREFFASNLPEEEEHVNWLETELSLVDEVGDANYLAQQIHQHEGAARRRAGCRASLPQRFPHRLR